MKTVKQLAAELNVSKSTLHRLIHDNNIETIQQGNKRLIDETIETAIIQALRNKVVHGETICNDSETVHRNDSETKYIQSLEQQIIDLKATIATLAKQLDVKDKQIEYLQALHANKIQQEQQPKVIEVKAAEQQAVRPQTVKRSTPKEPPKKKTLIDAVRSLWKR